MTWIKTVPLSEASAELMHSLESQRPLYPKEYEAPVMPMDNEMAGIVASHSLIPGALLHAFSTFGVLMSPDRAARPETARDDRNHGLGDQSLLLLNRIPRRVSA